MAPVIDEPLAQATCNGAANCPPFDGHAIGVIQENALKNPVFYVQYKDMTSRQTEPNEVTLKTLEPVSDFKKVINEMKSPSINKAPKLTNKETSNFMMSSKSS